MPPKAIGTAYGLTTAIQNIGLTISPVLASLAMQTDKKQGYFWTMVYYMTLSAIGCVINIWLYFDDLNNRDAVLDKVDKGEALAELLTSPIPTTRQMEDGEHQEDDTQ